MDLHIKHIIDFFFSEEVDFTESFTGCSNKEIIHAALYDIFYVQDCSDQFYIVSFYINWVTTSWTYSSRAPNLSLLIHLGVKNTNNNSS